MILKACNRTALHAAQSRDIKITGEHQSRIMCTHSSSSPQGPGTYEIQKDFVMHKAPEYTILERRSREQKSSGPGVGSYEVEGNLNVTRNRSPNAFIAD